MCVLPSEVIKPESCGFTCCEHSSVSDAHMVYETLNSHSINSVFTPSGRFSQGGGGGGGGGHIHRLHFSMAAHNLCMMSLKAGYS